MSSCKNIPDGFVKNPNFLLRCIPRCFSVRQVLIIARDLRASNLEFFSLPSRSDFLRLHHNGCSLFFSLATFCFISH